MKKNIIGYVLYAHDNDTEMYTRTSSAVPKCPACGYRTELYPHNPDYAFKKNFKPIYSMDKMEVSSKTTDYSCTYDGQIIVTQRFKDFCERQEYRGLHFLGFKKDKWHFQLIATQEIVVDLDRCNIRYDKRCPVCELCEWVGPTPEYYEISTPLPDGFFRSNLIIGSYYRRHPVMICGMETIQKIKTEKFNGIVFDPVYGIE